MNVGTDHDTAAFAVESIRCWWDTLGAERYPGARRLLVTADAGGSSGYRTRAWKTGLAALAAQAGLEITVCHFPPGTSKWDKIEHRLFSQISRNWRARPLTSHEVIIKTIAATTTRTGLAVTAALDERACPKGAKITKAQIRELEDTGALTRHGFCGDWNYTIRPAAARHIADLLSQHGTVITPGPHRLRTLDDLRRHAAAAGITIPEPPAPAPSTSQPRDTP